MPVFAIKLVEPEIEFECDSTKTLLDGMARLGKRGIPSGCRGGACGVCKIEVISGSFTCKLMSRSHISEEDERSGRVLACRTYPGSNMELRVLGGMKRCINRGS